MSATVANQHISVTPNELRFQFEPNKQSVCDLKVLNNTEQHVAFKVKTTSPKRYFVQPNIGVIKPRDSCIIRVTLQPQREHPGDMKWKDKFLLQSTIVTNTEVNDLPPDTFSKDNEKSKIEECKLRVLFITPTSAQRNSEDEALKYFIQNLDPKSSQVLQRLKEERDAAARQMLQLQQELDMMKRRINRRSGQGFSLSFAIFVGLIGTLLGLLLKLSLS